jgi:hypothetical protein
MNTSHKIKGNHFHCKQHKLTFVQYLEAYFSFDMNTGTMLGGSLSPQHGTSSGCGWRNGLQLWRVAANILNKQQQTNDKEWSTSLGVGRGVNNSSP